MARRATPAEPSVSFLPPWTVWASIAAAGRTGRTVLRQSLPHVSPQPPTPSMTVSFSAIQPGLKLADQVARQLEARIRAGNLQPGQKLPTEAELVQQLEVSRTVVREAVSQLKSRNLVESRQGSGVFVKAAGIEPLDRKSTRLNSSHLVISYAVFCLKK